MESNSHLKVIVKTNKPTTEITLHDKKTNTLHMNIHAQPIEGRANVEIIKFFKKKYKLNVEIISGRTSKTKLLKFI